MRFNFSVSRASGSSNRKITAILISAAFGALPYLTIAWPLFFIFIIPTFYILYSDADKGRFGFYYFIICPLVANQIVLLPVLRLSARAYLAVVLISSAYCSAALLLSRIFINKFNGKRFSVFIPVFFWILVNILLDFRSITQAIYNVGVYIPMTSPLIWYVGSAGITFLVITFNSSIAYYLHTKDKLILKLAIVILIIFGACFAYSFTRNPASLAKDKAPTKVALIQANIRKPWSWSQDNLPSTLGTYEALSLAAAKEKPDIIMWPEYALPVDILKYRKDVREAVSNVIKKCKTKFLIGSIVYDDLIGPHEDAGLLFDADGELTETYSSVEPAPFNTMARASLKPMHLMDGMGVMVCWEGLNRSIARKMTKMGARYLTVLANDQDLDFTWLQRIAPAYSKTRAAENMRYLARATNTGITQIVSPTGKVIKSLPSGKSGFLVGEVYLISTITFYTKYGDAIVLTALFLIFIFACFYVLKSPPI